MYNEGTEPLYLVALANTGTPPNAQEQQRRENISIDVAFTTTNGEPLDVTRLPQGEDFKAIVTVSALDEHARLENLALSVVAPSGWEINNDRMQGADRPTQLEYQDIRDDRILSYFALGNYYPWHQHNQRTLTLDINFNASYAGRFYLPGWRVESMYDEKVGANTMGQWVEVIAK